MNGVFTHRRLTGWLALAALALQLAVSFGHVHVPGLSPGVAAAHADAPGAPDEPLEEDHDCPVCTIRQLASTALLACAPALPSPAGHSIVLPPDPATGVGPAVHATAFLARGPPQT